MPDKCGTSYGYKIHRQRGETPCFRCKEANRLYQQEYRKTKPKTVKPTPTMSDQVDDSTLESLQERIPMLSSDTTGSYGKSLRVEIPSRTSRVDSILWRLYRVRAAASIASPRDLPSLVSAESLLLAELEEARSGGKSEEVNILDELAKRRQDRLSAS